MKSAASLTIAVTLGVLVAPALIGASPKKKPADADASKPAAAQATPAAPAAPATADDPSLPETVAVVEGAPIKKQELEKMFNAMVASQGNGMTASDVPADQRAQAYQMVLNDMIVDKLLSKRSAAEKVTDEEVTTTFERFKKNFGSDEEMKKQVEAHGQTIPQIMDDIRSSLRQQKWVDAQIDGKTEVADADAQAFYDKNPDKFQKPEQVRASHILVTVPEDAKPEVVAEKQKQAQAIADRVKKGEDFAKLAEQLSEDPSAKENKGDLDFFAKEMMVPEFADAAFSMKDNEISNPVRSKFGFHVIKVTGHKPAESVTFDQAKPQLLAVLKRHKKQEEIDKLVQGIRAAADVKINLPTPPEPAPLPALPGAAAATPAAPAPAPAPAPAAPPAPAKK